MSAHEPFRVLSIGNVYPPHLLGGYEVIWQGVMRRLAAEGDRPRVLVTDYRRPDTPPELPDDSEVHRELRWYWRDHAWPRRTFRQRLALERHNAEVFQRHVVDLRPQVVTWWALGGLSLGLVEQARKARLPSLFFVLDPWPVYGPQRDQWSALWGRTGPISALADRVWSLPANPRLGGYGRWLFCSESMRRTVAAAGLRVRNGAILSPGVEERFLTAPPEQAPPPWDWRLLYIGRVVEQKGVVTAIEALSLLPKASTLRIVGEGDAAYVTELHRLADRLGVSDQVQFHPPVQRSELVSVYRAADVVLFPVTWAEPWGLVPLEAMASGRPVVATGRGGSADFLRSGENCLQFPAGDAAALAQSITTLAQNSDLRERIREGGHATASRHSEEAFNRRAVREIRQAAESGAAPRAGRR